MGRLPFFIHREENIQKRYQENRAFLLSYGIQILGSRERAEDALQECFLSIIENQEKYFSLSCTDFRKLAVVIMKRKCIDQIRQEEKFVDQDIEELDFLLDKEPDPVFEEVLFKEREEEAREILRDLDPLSKKIFYLKYFDNKSYKEISQDLNITTNLVQVRLYRTKNRLRKLLKEEGKDG